MQWKQRLRENAALQPASNLLDSLPIPSAPLWTSPCHPAPPRFAPRCLLQRRTENRLPETNALVLSYTPGTGSHSSSETGFGTPSPPPTALTSPAPGCASWRRQGLHRHGGKAPTGVTQQLLAATALLLAGCEQRKM